MLAILVIVLLGIAAVILLRQFLAVDRLPLPPGPKPRPFIGNACQLPSGKQWVTATEWARMYGDLVFVRIPGKSILFINSVKVASDLLEKRSKIYSDRTYSTMIKLTAWDFNLLHMGYNDEWRKHRRMFQQMFRPDAVGDYQPVQRRKICLWLNSLLQSPGSFLQHNTLLSISIMMSIVYGYDVTDIQDHLIVIGKQAMSKMSECLVPGRFLVETFPPLQYLPSWVPGCSFQTFASHGAKLTTEMQHAPFNVTKERIKAGIGGESLVAKYLADTDHINDLKGAEREDVLRHVATTSYAGGVDTTVSSLSTIFRAMVMNPEAQRKAQQEIDDVTGGTRLPEFSDRESMPYCEAVYREVMRWYPVTPLGIAHTTSQDDVYNGYYIPKGTLCYPNVWSMTHDQRKYAEPDRFMPERFLDEKGKPNDDDFVPAFGFGRRICVGRFFADATVWYTIVCLLSIFNISPAKDENGNDIDITDYEYTDGAIIHPLPFPCSITPRSASSASIIEKAMMSEN